ncbi:hypothetical protein LguiB_031775 [Lonicera macranthoides]
MFTFHGTCRFLRKFKPLGALSSDCPFGYEKITLRCIHSLHQLKQIRPTRQINRYMKKSVKSFKKKDVDPKVYMRDTVRNISNILRYSTWDSAQEQLEKLSLRWDSYTINQVLKIHPPLEKAWLFFNWASRLRGFKHDQFTYTTMLDIFGEARRISSMNHVFKKMQEKDIKIDAVTYTSLIHWLSNDGDIDGAVKTWKEMKDKGCNPTVVSYTAYMKVLFDHNRVKEATAIYKEMIQSGCSPNCHTYTVLMVHLASSGKFYELVEIFSKMQETGVQPDKATCNILVDKCCKVGETGAMMKILQYMKENSFVLRYPVYMEALETLRIAGKSDVLLKQVNPHISAKFINHEEKNNFDATTTDIHSIIDQGLVLNMLARHNFVAVDRLLADMMDKNIQLHSEIISSIIEVYSAHSRPKSASLAFEYSLKMGISFEKTSYLTLIGVFVRTNSFPKIVEIIEAMFNAGFAVGTHLSALLIYRLGHVRKLGLATKLFQLLPSEQRSTSAYTALMGAYFSIGKVEKGLETFNEMRSNGICVALGTYNVLLAGLEKNGKVTEVESYRKEKKRLQTGGSSQLGVSMDEKICNILFAGDVVS